MRRIQTGREQYEALNPLPWRVADNNYDPAVYQTTDFLRDEFTDWWAKRVKDNGWSTALGDDTYQPRPPLNSWEDIERFLKDIYPEAHRGLSMGQERAQPLIDQQVGRFGDPIPEEKPYETGQEAIAQHGYDPKETVAGMLLLHNEAHGYRQDLAQMDHDRLYEIAQTRSKMQRDYEKKNQGKKPELVTARRLLVAAFQAHDQANSLPWRNERTASFADELAEWNHYRDKARFFRPGYDRRLSDDTYRKPLRDPMTHPAIKDFHNWMWNEFDKVDYDNGIYPGHPDESYANTYKSDRKKQGISLDEDASNSLAAYVKMRQQDYDPKAWWGDDPDEKTSQGYQEWQAFQNGKWKPTTASDHWKEVQGKWEAGHEDRKGRASEILQRNLADWGGDFSQVPSWLTPSHMITDEMEELRDRPDDVNRILQELGHAPESTNPQQRQANWLISAELRIAAAMSVDFLNGLNEKFHDWSGNGCCGPSDHPRDCSVGDWPTVENFFQEEFPAAHRGFDMCLEEARPLVRGEENTLEKEFPTYFKANPRDYSADAPYETGPEAEAKHGYDPRNVAAGMVLLHNRTNGMWQDRDDETAQDVDLLNNIFRTRMKMQRAYDNRQTQPAAKELVTANRVVREAMRLMATAPTLPQTGVIEPPQDLSPEDEQRVIGEINDHLSYNRPRAATELWAQSGIPLSNLTRSGEIASHIRVWGFPQGIDSEWAQAELDDYTLDNYRRDPSENPLPRNQTPLSDLYAEDNNEGNLGSFEEAFGDAQMEDDEDDQSCPDCDFTTFFDRDMMRHRYIRHNDEDALNEHFGLTPYQPPTPPPDPSAPVENTTDPSAKLKSPWYKKVQHYPSGELPSEFGKRNLYRDFNFGVPEVATDSPERGWYRHDPDQGVYQINDSRRPLHKPPVGYVHYEADHDDKTVKIKYLDVHPKKRGQGVATALVSALAEDFPDYKIAPGSTTSHGTGFVNYMQKNAPGAKERLDTDQWSPAPANVLTDDQLNEWGATQRRSPVFAFIDRHNARVAMRRMRIAAFDQELIDRLRGEYHDWYDENGNEALNWAGRGPLGNWRQIENFMKTKYPAAHRGLNAGQESVMPLLDFGSRVLSPLNGQKDTTAPYETGPEAFKQYGYDPKEVAAGMLLLHNQSHPQRGDMLDYDIDRLSDIAQKRQQMQNDYEQRQPQPITAALDLLRMANRIAGSRIT